MLGRIETCFPEQFIDILRHGEQGGPGVETVTLEFKLREFATGVAVGLEDFYLVPPDGHSRCGGEAGNSGSNDGDFQNGCFWRGNKNGERRFLFARMFLLFKTKSCIIVKIFRLW